MKKKYFSYFINENIEFILSSEMKCLKSRFLLITGWGESGKAKMKLYYLQCKQFQIVVFGKVRSWAVFPGTVKTFFRAKMFHSL